MTNGPHSRDWMENAMLSAGIGVWEHDLRTKVVLHRGEVWSQLDTGPGADQKSWDALLQSVHADDVPIVRRWTENLVAGQIDHHPIEIRMRGRTGDWRWVQSTGSAVERDADGRSVVLVGTIQDCTERKEADRQKRELEQQLRHAQKMESVGTLAGGLAHDFNNVLLAILGNVDLALAGLPGPTPETEDALQQIRQSAERGAALAHRLLTFTQKHGTTQRRIAVDDLLADLLPMLRRLIPATISLELRAACDGAVLADVGQLEQIVVNLVVNARDAMREGAGRIELATALVSLDEGELRARSWVSPGDFVRLSFIDSGHGIAPEIAERIFDPFFTTKPVGKGTGLGLSIVYAVAQQHGGYVTVQSEAGHGARFDVFLPAMPKPKTDDRPKTRSVRPAGGSEIILLAEDEPAVRKMTVRILTKAGYEVVAAADGDEAVAKFFENPDLFHLALLDVVMPGKTGGEVFDAIRAKRPDLKVLFTTGYSAGAVRSELLAAPGVAQITKPYNGAALLRQMRELLDQDD